MNSPARKGRGGGKLAWAVAWGLMRLGLTVGLFLGGALLGPAAVCLGGAREASSFRLALALFMSPLQLGHALASGPLALLGVLESVPSLGLDFRSLLLVGVPYGLALLGVRLLRLGRQRTFLLLVLAAVSFGSCLPP